MSHLRLAPGRTALYRLLAANGRLLYVGISKNPDVRWGTHSNTQPWWSEVADRKAEWFTTREEAEAAEIAAIKEERPLYNKQHSVTRNLRPKLPEQQEELVSPFRSPFRRPEVSPGPSPFRRPVSDEDAEQARARMSPFRRRPDVGESPFARYLSAESREALQDLEAADADIAAARKG